MDVRVELQESWALKNWCFWTVVLEKTLESPLDCKEIQPVNTKGNQSWIFTGQSFGHLIWRTNSLEKTPMLRKIEGRRRRDNRGWDGWIASPTQTWVWVTSGVGDGQGSLVCCSPWGRNESDMTEQLSWTELDYSPMCHKREVEGDLTHTQKRRRQCEHRAETGVV